MSAKILVTGAGGQVGNALAAADGPFACVALGRGEMDITNRRQVSSTITRHEPSMVINGAAYTNVDQAETDKAQAFAVNRDGVANLAQACLDQGIPLLHVSTDYVFDGSKQGEYREDDPVSPLGVYGRSKAEGEDVLREILPQHIILRTSWVFSATGSNFVKTMLRLGLERDELNIVNDQYGCPTSASSIAQVLISIAESYLRGDQIDWGTYHFCNKPPTTWYRFARTIFSSSRIYENLAVNPVESEAYPTPAARPKNSVLDCSKIEQRFEISRCRWKLELQSVLDTLGYQ